MFRGPKNHGSMDKEARGHRAALRHYHCSYRLGSRETSRVPPLFIQLFARRAKSSLPDFSVLETTARQSRSLEFNNDAILSHTSIALNEHDPSLLRALAKAFTVRDLTSHIARELFQPFGEISAARRQRTDFAQTDGYTTWR